MAPSDSIRTAAAALAVHVEPLAAGARILVIGGSELEPMLRELGARSVHVFDVDTADIEVRDGAFDLAIVCDLGRLRDPANAVRRLRRVVDPRGSVVAMGRARTDDDDDASPFPELLPARIAYAELYDVFALQFESVTMTGVLPFEGVVFAELGGADDDVAVSVDTRLAPAAAPSVFVVVAGRDARELDPYAIVQVPNVAGRPSFDAGRERELVTAFAAMQLKAELLGSQLEEARANHARAIELESLLVTAQQAIAMLERRVLERDDQMAALLGELDAQRRAEVDLASSQPDPELVDALTARAERAEAALALHIADLAPVAEAHLSEMAGVELQLRERAQLIAAMEKELARREQLVKELVGELEVARSGENGVVFQATPAAPPGESQEVARLRKKLDELALEIARRDGELVAAEWRQKELESRASRPASDPELDRVKNELDALRQALTQEHSARVAAESDLRALRGSA